MLQVVDARDDKDGDEDMPHRVGRMKVRVQYNM